MPRSSCTRTVCSYSEHLPDPISPFSNWLIVIATQSPANYSIRLDQRFPSEQIRSRHCPLSVIAPFETEPITKCIVTCWKLGRRSGERKRDVSHRHPFLSHHPFLFSSTTEVSEDITVDLNPSLKPLFILLSLLPETQLVARRRHFGVGLLALRPDAALCVCHLRRAAHLQTKNACKKKI